MADYYIENPPPLDYMDPQTMRSVIGEGGDLAKSARYFILVNRPTIMMGSSYADMPQQLAYMCEGAELPGRSLNTINYRYYGPTKLMPYQSEYNNIGLTFIVRNHMREKQFFDDWFEAINPTANFDMSYRRDYETKIDIFTMVDYDDGVSSATYKMTLEQAIPVGMEPMALSYGDDQYMRLIVNFHYSKFIRKGHDIEPAQFSLVEQGETVRTGGTVIPRVLGNLGGGLRDSSGFKS